MLKIRNSIFETNSSSVHTLSVAKDAEINETELNKHMEIQPYSEKEWDDMYYSTDRDAIYALVQLNTLEDKLRYICTIFARYNHWRDDDKVNELLGWFKNICPNVEFLLKPDYEIAYIEDSEILFADGGEYFPTEFTKWSIDQWKRWLCSGSLLIFDRDEFDRFGEFDDERRDERIPEADRMANGYETNIDCIQFEG